MKIINALFFLGIFAFLPQPLQAQEAGKVPLYNISNAKTLPLSQMVAGQSAPSYTYNPSNSSSPSTYSDPNAALASAPMSSTEALALRAQRDALAQQYASEYYASLQNGQNVGWQGGGSKPALLGAAPFFQPQETPPQRVERRVIYKELKDPLAPPPRLIDPDR